MPLRIRTNMLSQSFLRSSAAARAPIRLPAQARRFTPAPAVSGYGDPGQTGADGANPKANDPLEEKSSKMEHPGPEPVEEGKHPGGQASGETSQSGNGGKPQPKLNASQEPSRKGDQSVEQHNKEFENRAGHSSQGKDQKVEKDYWSGHGGRDREP